MESTDVYWIQLYELLENCGIEVALADCASVAARAGPQERHAGPPVVAVAAQLRAGAGLVPARGGDHAATGAAPATGQLRGMALALRAMDAADARPDERAGTSGRERPDGTGRTGDRRRGAR